MLMSAVTVDKQTRGTRHSAKTILLALFAITQTVAADVFSRQTSPQEQRTMTSRFGLFREDIIDMNDINGFVTGSDITAYDVVDVRSCIECTSLCVNVNCVSYACHNQLCTRVSICTRISVLNSRMYATE